MLLSDDIFFSLWYWFFAVAFWTGLTHSAHGVPAGIARRAARLGGEDAELFHRLLRRAAELRAATMRRWGAAVAAFAGFGLGALAMAGFGAGRDWAAGLFLLLAPAALMRGLELAEGAKVAARPDLDTETLLAVWRRRHVANQTFSALALGVAAIVLALRHRHALEALAGM
ncbi:MAG: hypothetical protein ACQEUZ_05160 [Pseudomonadota bacterium]